MEKEEVENKLEVDDKRIDISGKGRFFSFIFSFMPGAGHMYLGLMNKGIVLMSLFLISLIFVSWLNIRVLSFLPPVLLAYSIFDIMNIKKSRLVYDLDFESKEFKELKTYFTNKNMGIVLIVLGGLGIMQNVFYPLLYRFINHRLVIILKAMSTSAVFIIVGIYLIYKKQSKIDGEEN